MTTSGLPAGLDCPDNAHDGCPSLTPDRVAAGVDAVRRPARAARDRPGRAARPDAGGDRGERVRQDGAAEAGDRPAPADRGPGAVRRARTGRLAGTGTGPATAALRLSVSGG